jgi:ABC-2 type transport system permease protein
MDKKLMVVIRREYLERVRSKWFLASTLLVPVFFAGIMLIPAASAARARASATVSNITILDATSSGLGARIQGALATDSGPGASTAQLRTVTTAEIADAEAAALADVQARRIEGYLLLRDTVMLGGPAYYAGRNASSMGDVERLRTVVRQSVTGARLEAQGVQSAAVDSIVRMSVRLQAERIGDRGRGGSAATAMIGGMMLAMLLYMSILLHGQNVMRGVLEEKMNRVAEVVLSSVRPDTLLAGKVLGVGAVGLTQIVVWFAVGAAVMNFFLPLVLPPGVVQGMAPAGADAAAQSAITAAVSAVNLWLVLVVILYFLAGFIFYASLYAAAGAMVNSEQEAQQAAMPVILLMVGTIVFLNPVLMQPNGTLAVALSWLPFSSPIIMPMRVMLGSVPWYEVAGSLLIAFAGGAAVVWLAARIYRVGMLMYGKRPSMRELARWVRQA